MVSIIMGDSTDSRLLCVFGDYAVHVAASNL